MGLSWLNNGFICKELYAPFILSKDADYIKDLNKRFLLLQKQAEKAGADDESIKIIKKYKRKIIESLKCYYRADISKSNTIIYNLVKDIGENPFAVNQLNKSYAFHGNTHGELQFFRCRLGNPSKSFKAKEMLFIPEKMRTKSGNYRFSIPGNPCLYLANSSYGCWIETGFPSESDFNVAPVILDGTQKIFNLAVTTRDFTRLNNFESTRVHCWIKLLMLSLATSYRVTEEGRTFKSEYLISQSIMMACKKLKYDGVAYYSKRVDDELFALCAINLVLFVDYDSVDSVIKHMKMDDSFNYILYKQLEHSLKYKSYEMSSVSTGLVTNIGNYTRQYPYRETEFFHFDQFLFYTWRDKINASGKDKMGWGEFV
ncbi:MAG: RES domain-containing protein [Eubacteriales bacterium]|nr:RES domain-containing protein [Eubacteriales bacterium]